MTAQVTLLAFLTVIGVFALALYHALGWHADRDYRRQRRAELIQQQLDRAKDYPDTHDIDGPYREMLDQAAREMAAPYDYALSGFGEEGLRQVFKP